MSPVARICSSRRTTRGPRRTRVEQAAGYARITAARITAVRLIAALLLTLLLPAPRLHAAETDPYYAWFHPPRDSTALLDSTISDRLERGLAEINRSRERSAMRCADVAARMVAPLRDTAMHFFYGGIRSWGVRRAPQSRTEYDEVLRREGTYRYALLLPFGSLVPFDPTLQVAGVLVGTDKIGHFFTNGLRTYDRYRALRARGLADDVATREAAMVGVEEESGGLGMCVSGIFSYADIQANDRGFAFFRALCEGPDPELALNAGRWVLRRPFTLSRWVDPCWDEGWNVSAFVEREAAPVRRAVEEMCPRWWNPRVQERRSRYRAQGCVSTATPVLDALIARGAIPDPRPWNPEVICARAGAATTSLPP